MATLICILYIAGTSQPIKNATAFITAGATHSPEKEAARIVNAIMETRALNVPDDCARDNKKIQQFLESVAKNFNRLLRGC